MYNTVKRMLKALPGQTGFYYKTLDGGEIATLNEDRIFNAASMIKLPVLVEAFNQVRLGEQAFERTYEVRSGDKVPSCGALTYMHDGLEVTFRDLCVLMIIHSDNTAANMLIRILGMDRINQTLIDQRLYMTRLERLLFDAEAAREGIENLFVLEEMAALFEAMYRGTLISRKASADMLEILKCQRLNHKMPALLPRHIPVAHKTGEDAGITHDMGIVFADRPFLIGFAASGTQVPQAEQAIREITRIAYNRNSL